MSKYILNSNISKGGEEMIDSRLKNSIDFCKSTIQCIENSLSNIESEMQYDNAQNANIWATDLIEASEDLCIEARRIPAYIGDEFINDKGKKADVENAVLEAWNIKIEFMQQGWLYIKIPAIIPKIKRKKSSTIYFPLQTALEKFFKNKIVDKTIPSVICYRFVYKNDIPESHYHDHDNKEIKLITDLIAVHTVVDDCPKYLNNYCCSASGEESCTEIFLVPREDFSRWLDYEKTIRN